MTFAPFALAPERSGRQALIHRRFVAFIAVWAALTILGGCETLGGGTLGGRAADDAIGPARTPEARQCRLEILIAGASVVMTDRVVDDGDRGEANQALAQMDELDQALANTRGASSVFRETELARARGALALAVGSRLRDRVMAYLTGGAITEAKVVRAILSASTGAAVIADAAQALKDMESGTLDLAGCQAAVDGQLKTQRGRLEAVGKLR